MEKHAQVLANAVASLLRPLVRVLLRHRVSCGAFTELVRRIYVEVAESEFGPEARKQTVSRVAVLTGLNRKEVARLQKLPPLEQTGLDERYGRGARVISGWLRDKRFLDKKGDPEALPFEGKLSFTELVKKYSGDMPPRAVADELQAAGALELTTHGDLRLTARGYVPASGELEKIHVLGTDTRDLISAIDHNLTSSPEDTRFQRKVTYDNVPLDAIDEFRALSSRLGQDLLEHLNEWLAQRDRDANSQSQGEGRARVGLGIYLIEDIIDEGRQADEPVGQTGKEKK